MAGTLARKPRGCMSDRNLCLTKQIPGVRHPVHLRTLSGGLEGKLCEEKECVHHCRTRKEWCYDLSWDL